MHNERFLRVHQSILAGCKSFSRSFGSDGCIQLVMDNEVLMLDKTYSIQTEATLLQIRLLEYFDSKLQFFTYPSSLVLTAYICSQSRSICQGKAVLELGAGTALPSITAASCGARRVIVTDRDEPLVMERVRCCLQLNEDFTLDTCEVRPLPWRALSVEEVEALGAVDTILGADILYSGENFDPVLATVASIAVANPSVAFYTTYEERSAKRTLVPFLDKYGLRAESIPLESFLHDLHGSCVEMEATSTSEGEVAAVESENVAEVVLGLFDGIFLLKIVPQPPCTETLKTPP